MSERLLFDDLDADRPQAAWQPPTLASEPSTNGDCPASVVDELPKANGYASQAALFDVDEFERWRDEWQGMPEFIQEDLMPMRSLVVHFSCRSDIQAFSELIGQSIKFKTKSIWFPEAEIGRFADKRYAHAS